MATTNYSGAIDAGVSRFFRGKRAARQDNAEDRNIAAGEAAAVTAAEDRKFQVGERKKASEASSLALKSKKREDNIAELGVPARKRKINEEKIKSSFSEGFRKYKLTGDMSGIENAYRNYPDGYSLTFKKDADGNIISTRTNDKTGETVSGQLTPDQFDSGVMDFITDPVKKYTDAQKPRKKFSSSAEGVLNQETGDFKAHPAGVRGGRRGTTPAILQETDAIFRRLSKKDGENDSQRWLRAHATASNKGSTSPNDAAAKFYTGILSTLSKNAVSTEDSVAAEANAKRLTKDFVDKYYPSNEVAAPGVGGAGGPGGGVEQPTATGYTRPVEGGPPQLAPNGKMYVMRNGQLQEANQ